MTKNTSKIINSDLSNVKVVYAGGDGLQEAYKILAKIVVRKLQDKNKEKVNEGSNLHQG